MGASRQLSMAKVDGRGKRLKEKSVIRQPGAERGRGESRERKLEVGPGLTKVQSTGGARYVNKRA